MAALPLAALHGLKLGHELEADRPQSNGKFQPRYPVQLHCLDKPMEVVPAAVIVMHILAAVANKLALYPLGNIGAAHVVRERVAEGVERHAPIGHATGVPQIAAEPLTPLMGKVPVRAGGELVEQPLSALVLHGLNEPDKAKAL